MPMVDPHSQDSTLSVATPPKLLGDRHRLIAWVDGTERIFPLRPNGSARVGRTREAEIRINAPTVSRLHAKLDILPGMVVLSDLKSHNGVRLNGERVTSERSLAYGDVITFGSVTAIFDRDPGPDAPARAEGAISVGRTLDLDGVAVVIEDTAMSHVYMQLQRLAVSDLSVLIIGHPPPGQTPPAPPTRFLSTPT